MFEILLLFTDVYAGMSERTGLAPVFKLDFVHSPISVCNGPVAKHVESIMWTVFTYVGQLRCVESSSMSPVEASLRVYADDVVLLSPPAVVLPGDPETIQTKETASLTVEYT